MSIGSCHIKMSFLLGICHVTSSFLSLAILFCLLANLYCIWNRLVLLLNGDIIIHIYHLPLFVCPLWPNLIWIPWLPSGNILFLTFFITWDTGQSEKCKGIFVLTTKYINFVTYIILLFAQWHIFTITYVNILSRTDANYVDCHSTRDCLWYFMIYTPSIH